MRISKEHLDIINKQFYLDCNLFEAEKINDHFFIAPTKVLDGSRVINKLDPFFRVIIFFGKLYVMADEETIPGWVELFKDSSPDWFFNYGNLRKIDYILNEYDREIIDTHIFFLPDNDAPTIDVPRDFQWINEDMIPALKDSIPFHNAFCFSPTQPDYIGVVAPVDCNTPFINSDGSYVSDSLKGAAGASIDGRYVRQIGIDVDPNYLGQGLATSLVTSLKQRILSDNLLPFYGTSESHSISRMVGTKSGFIPAFAELFVAKKEKKLDTIYNQ